jgi:hypothetical protein
LALGVVVGDIVSCGLIGEIGNVAPVSLEDRALAAFAVLEDIAIADDLAPAAA